MKKKKKPVPGKWKTGGSTNDSFIGNKRKDLDEDSRHLILKAYDGFSNKEYKDIFDKIRDIKQKEEFGVALESDENEFIKRLNTKNDYSFEFSLDFLQLEKGVK